MAQVNEMSKPCSVCRCKGAEHVQEGPLVGWHCRNCGKYCTLEAEAQEDD